MILILIYVESSILFSLSILHLSWALGGDWGFEKSLPTNEKGERVLNPKRMDSAIVGIGLLFFSIFYQIKGGVITMDLPLPVLSSAGWVISMVFLLRAIGDFKYIGFSKRVKNTEFAKLDSIYFSPLCLLLGIIGIILEFVIVTN